MMAALAANVLIRYKLLSYKDTNTNFLLTLYV